MVRSDWNFEIRLLFSLLKLALSSSTRIRRTLTPQSGVGRFVLIVEQGVLTLSNGKCFRLHAFLFVLALGIEAKMLE